MKISPGWVLSVIAIALVSASAERASATAGQFLPLSLVDVALEAPAPYGESRLIVEMAPPDPHAAERDIRHPGRVRRPDGVQRLEFVTEQGPLTIPPEMYRRRAFSDVHVTTAKGAEDQQMPILAINLGTGRDAVRIFIREDRVIGYYTTGRTVRLVDDADDEVIDHPADPYAEQPEEPAWLEEWRVAIREPVTAREIRLVGHAPQPYGESAIHLELSAPSDESETRIVRFDFETEEGPIAVPPETYRGLRHPQIGQVRLTQSYHPATGLFVAVELPYEEADGSQARYRVVTQNLEAVWYDRGEDRMIRLDDVED